MNGKYGKSAIGKIFHAMARPQWLALMCALTLLAAMQPATAKPQASKPKFDHVSTGFTLSGAHARARCASCHVQNVFKGTPRDCATCHMVGNRMGAMAKPARHVTTAAPCDSCHRSASWTPATFSHVGIAPGSCTSCHNGMTAAGKPGGHVATTAPCDSCHRSTSWTPAGFNHMGVAPGTCATCHNGSTATGKPGGHVITTAPCDSCHRTTGWLPASFSHTGVAPGTCATCHNGTTATGKPGAHILTTSSCDSCHRTTAWVPATFSHTGVTPGTCATCHNGTTATGKSSGHFVTTLACDACHNTTGWIPLKAYSHTSPDFKRHASVVTCIACHKSNSDVISWTYAAYKPDCAGCHAARFVPGPHKKTEVPGLVLYTVAELKNCAGSCHMYTDNTFTTILVSRTGHHRSTDGGF